jgi:hypothetical protein
MVQQVSTSYYEIHNNNVLNPIPVRDQVPGDNPVDQYLPVPAKEIAHRQVTVCMVA